MLKNLTHQPLVYFIIILVFIMGVYSYQNLGRMEDPDFVLRQMVVSVAWPGAGEVAICMTAQVKSRKRFVSGSGNGVRIF